ncbi:UNVERIFIED_CONTAM: tRNA wybutosine-synthesizing protein 2/3/4 [Sesamum radiatum]|uniref:tRNA wybutosine-synthesizing protein 2/3/4 n=1 Tax=Sesamum radiatum TaxID=300843 RepID=A0AAW2KJC0_SESRA
MLAAQSLVSLAISCGFRESGITSVSKRVIIAIRCSIRLEVPLGDIKRLMVSPEDKQAWIFGDPVENGVKDLEAELGSESKHKHHIDDESGVMETIAATGAPSPRLGHTSSVIGDFIYVIGGRADPMNILNEVWVFSNAKKEWKLLPCSGTLFRPSCCWFKDIYVFGGIDNDAVLSSLYVFDTDTFEWSEIEIQGDQPGPRHSHSMDASGSKLYIFGGYNGEKALGDLYSFDIKTGLWRKLKANGQPPNARFSHLMFIYSNHLGIFGGCPVSDHQKLSLFDLQSESWKNIVVKPIEEGLFVRSTANVVDDDLIIIGGGASCYAFGTKFSEPMKINLLQLMSSRDNTVPTAIGEKHVDYQTEQKSNIIQHSQNVNEQKVIAHNDLDSEFEEPMIWLEDISSSAAMNLLMTCCANKIVDKVMKVKKTPISPFKVMKDAVATLLNHHDLPSELLEQLPSRWERLGISLCSLYSPSRIKCGTQLERSFGLLLQSHLDPSSCPQGRVAQTGTRDSKLEILVGDNGWVDHRENGVLYSLMQPSAFSWGNLSEKLRMSHLDCKDQVIVDLFAGIGYFVLPFLVRANAKMVYACEWNPHAIEALRRNLEANSVADRCVVLEGDNRVTAKGVADRVCLGLLPSSECSWVTAVRALRCVDHHSKDFGMI